MSCDNDAPHNMRPTRKPSTQGQPFPKLIFRLICGFPNFFEAASFTVSSKVRARLETTLHPNDRDVGAAAVAVAAIGTFRQIPPPILVATLMSGTWDASIAMWTLSVVFIREGGDGDRAWANGDGFLTERQETECMTREVRKAVETGVVRTLRWCLLLIEAVKRSASRWSCCWS